MPTGIRSSIAAVTRSWPLPVTLALGALMVAIALMFAAAERAEREAIESLPAAERQALYERIRVTLASSCAPQTAPRGLDDFCRAQAELITQFPECDERCLSLAGVHLRKPTR